MSKNDIKNNYWDEIIVPKSNLLSLHLREIIKYKDLIFLFVKRDIVTVYKQTILGPLLYIFPPILTAWVFNTVFTSFAKFSTDGVPGYLFYLSGIVTWNYFSEALTRTSSTFVSNASVFGKVYFPRLIAPISTVLSSLIKFTTQFILFLAVLFYYKFYGNANIYPNIYVLLTPVLVLLMIFLGLGFGILISSLTTKYRDFRFIMGFVVTLWMYATPVIYPLSSVPEHQKIWIVLNPMTSIVETFRYAYLGSGIINWMSLLYTTVFSFFLVIIGVVFFNRVEKNFMDTV